MKKISVLKEKFRKMFGGDARIYRAPGRVNLIGEHTDYNDGFVMPAAIGLSTYVAVAPRTDCQFVVYSENFAERAQFGLNDVDWSARDHWTDYVRAVVASLTQAGFELGGANLLIRSEVPIGSGLSSSAAIEVSTGYGLLDVFDFAIDRVELARLCQRAENEYVGMRCGIMDQFASCNGRAGQALLLDCRSLDYRLLKLSDKSQLVVCNTMVRHQLAGGEYNRRRADCEAGVNQLAKSLRHIRALRDVTLEDLERHKRDLPTVIFRRCRHVISENARTLRAAEALEGGDLATFGNLMSESHYSLRHDYEVSCEELDLMVELARKVEGVFGARMMGGGFGGCTINLASLEAIDEFERVVRTGYEKVTGRSPEIYVCSAGEGAERIA